MNNITLISFIVSLFCMWSTANVQAQDLSSIMSLLSKAKNPSGEESQSSNSLFGSSSTTNALLQLLNKNTAGSTQSSSATNPLSSLLGGALGGNSPSNLLSSLIGNGGDMSTSSLLTQMLLSGSFTAKTTAAPVVGTMTPDYFGNQTTTTQKRPAVDSKTCDMYFTLVRQDGKIADIAKMMLLQSGCINQILSNPLIFLGGGDIGDIFDEIMDLIGFGKDEETDNIWEGAANGPLDLALIQPSAIDKCFEYRWEYSRDYNCKVGVNINIKTEQECLNIGCFYTSGGLCFRCPHVKEEMQANQIPSETCSLNEEERQECPDFDKFFTLSQFVRRSGADTKPSSRQGSLPSLASLYSGGSTNSLASLMGGGGSTNPLASLMGGGGSSNMYASLLGGMGSNTNALASALGASGLPSLGSLYNGGASSSFGGIDEIFLKKRCESEGCCWDGSKTSSLFGASAEQCFKRAIPKSQEDINTCYNSQTCGKTDTGILQRIIGGIEAKSDKDRPWQVIIRKSGNSEIRCSGAIICSQWILTTASCLTKMQPLGTNQFHVNLDPNSVDVIYGTKSALTGTNVANVLEIKVHKDYQTTQSVHDIALIQVQQLTFTESAKPVCLPGLAASPLSSGKDVYVTGYGKSDEWTPQGTLKEIKAVSISYETCRDVYYSSLPPKYGIFCANPANSNEDTCTGDGGAPAVSYDSSSEIFTLVGVNFAGSSDCSGLKPMVFVDVAVYRNWIMSTTNGCCGMMGSRVN